MFCDFIVTNRPKEYLFFLKYSKDQLLLFRFFFHGNSPYIVFLKYSMVILMPVPFLFQK